MNASLTPPYVTFKQEEVNSNMKREGYKIFTCGGSSGAYGTLLCNTGIGISCFTLGAGSKELTTLEKDDIDHFCEDNVGAPLESTIRKKKEKLWKKN